VNRHALQVSFSSQNCNSLNVSTSLRGQASKIVSISDLNTDIIFLCDTRLNGKHLNIIDSFRLRYHFYYNSSMNKRGVAVLIRNGIDFSVLEEVRDAQENALLLRILLQGREVLIGSIYGPNTNDLTLFEFLETELQRRPGIPVILGGDWNASYSNLPADSNPDVCFMRTIPSLRRTERILQLCADLKLSDPYCCLNPEEEDYTYIPSGVLRSNRSRIDFFLISDDIFADVISCSIQLGQTTKLSNLEKETTPTAITVVKLKP
jgi:exonuclease III